NVDIDVIHNENRTETIDSSTPAEKTSQITSLIFAGIAYGSDGYQANAIGAVSSFLGEIYGSVYDSYASTRVSNAMLIGDIIGQVGFGILIDRLGRKFGIIACTSFVCLGIVLATASSGLTPQGLFWMLCIARGVTGVGVGGEYPCCSTAASESAEESGRSRGFWLVICAFIVSCGFLLGTIVPVILLAICGENALEPAWRLTLGLGLVLPVTVLYFRLKMLNSRMYRKEAMQRNVPYGLIFKHYWKYLLASGGIWFLYDFISYSFGIFSDLILAVAVPGNTLMQTLEWNIVLNVFYPFGALAGAFFVDRWGRKNTMAAGFFIQAAFGIAIGASAPHLINVFPLFVILYGIFLFFGEFGPGDCTILVASEIYPTAIRGQMMGLSAAIGKAGAAIGTQVFKPILTALTANTGDAVKAEGYLFIIGSCIAILGGILTLLLVPEMSKDKMAKNDEEFRKLLIDNGYDITQLGIRDQHPQDIKAGLESAQDETK
ncbi:major facilitator superfamily domain-containing protein, partial [Umbelopsis sp. PMI_123]